MKNEEERHKFEAKRTSDKKITNKIVKSGAIVSICGLQTMQPRDHFLRTAGVHLWIEGKQTDRRFQLDLLTVIFSFWEIRLEYFSVLRLILLIRTWKIRKRTILDIIRVFRERKKFFS
jgi:hypothetical protein